MPEHRLTEADRSSLRPETVAETMERRAREEAWRLIIEPSVTHDACDLRRRKGKSR